MEVTLNQFIGYSLKAPDGPVGKVCDFYLDTHFWKVRYLIVETGDGLKKRNILISTDAVLDPDAASKTYPLRLSLSQIQFSLNVNADYAPSIAQKTVLDEHFLWSKYPGTIANEFPSINSTKLTFSNKIVMSTKALAFLGEDKSELKKLKNLIGCKIQSREIVLGTVAEFIIKESNWEIRYIIIKVDNSISKKQLLIDSHYLNNVNITSNVLELNL